MAFVQFFSVNRELSRAVAGKLFTAGLICMGFGALILAFPMILALVVAGFSFLAGFGLISGAARAFLAGKAAPPAAVRREFQDANWREID